MMKKFLENKYVIFAFFVAGILISLIIALGFLREYYLQFEINKQIELYGFYTKDLVVDSFYHFKVCICETCMVFCGVFALSFPLFGILKIYFLDGNDNGQ